MIADDETRHTLLWLAEQLTAWEGIETDKFRSPCAKCSHDRADHAVGGDADNPSPWPCNFPQSRGGPTILCYCGDYQPMTEEP